MEHRHLANYLFGDLESCMQLIDLRFLLHAGRAGRSRRRSQRSCEFSFASTMSCLIALLVTSSAMAADAPSISWMQLFPATSPTPRSYFAMTYDAASEKVIVFGGFDGAGYLNDIWTFDGVNWTKVNTPPCPPCAPMPDGL